MDVKKFKMRDEKFVCLNCKMLVKPLGYTARDHCPYCLTGLHIDIFPGDRASTCLGLLKPIDIEKGKKDAWKIVYKCAKCGELKKNKTALDDDYDLILEVMKK